jgi:hypothetical protein
VQTASGKASNRIISIVANEYGRACGWIDLGPVNGVAFFDASSRIDAPGFDVSFSPIQAGDMRGRVTELFYRQLEFVLCSPEPGVPPAPSGARLDVVSDQKLHSLWDSSPPKWALISPRGLNGYVGVARRSGGGLIMTPTFPSIATVQAWLSERGDTMAEAADLQGRSAQSRFDACLTRNRSSKHNYRCASDGMDEVVELQR